MPHDHPHDHAHGHSHDHPHDHHHDGDHHHHHHPRIMLHSVRVYAGDFQAAYTFYSEALGLTPVGGDGRGAFAMFDTGAVKLALEHIPPNHPAFSELVGRFAGVSLVVENLAASYQELAGKGVEFMAPPQRQAWGGGIAHFRDTAGNILSLIGRLDGSAK